MASLFAAGLVLLVILVIGPYFYYLPKCVLAAIIIVNLRSIFRKMTAVPALWRESRADALVWIITCGATAILEPVVGLLVGIVACVLFVLMRSQLATVDVVSEVGAGDLRLWRSEDRYVGGKVQAGGVKVVRINSALYFANAEIMTDRMFKKTGVNPTKVKKKGVSADVKANAADDGVQNGLSVTAAEGGVTMISMTMSNTDSYLVSSVTRDTAGLPAELTTTVPVAGSPRLGAEALPDPSTEDIPSDTVPFSHLVVDLSPVPFVDVMGVQALEFLITKYQAVGISVYFANAQENCVDTLQKTGFLKKHGDIVFLTTSAAIEHASAVLRV